MNKIKENLRSIYKVVKGANLSVGNMLFYEVIISISLLPVVFAVFLLLYIFFMHITDEWAFKVQDYTLKVITTILTAQVMTCILAFGGKLKDRNNDGVSDDDEKGGPNP